MREERPISGLDIYLGGGTSGVINGGVADIDNAPTLASVTYWKSLTEEEKAALEDWEEMRRQTRFQEEILRKVAEEGGQEVIRK